MLKNLVPEWIKSKGLSLSEFHRTTKLSWPTILKWAGSNAPAHLDHMNARTMIHFADALGVEITDLYERQENGDNG